MKIIRRKITKVLVRMITKRNAKVEKNLLAEVWSCQDIKNIEELHAAYMKNHKKICVEMYMRKLSEQQAMRLQSLSDKLYRQRKTELEKKTGLLIAAR